MIFDICVLDIEFRHSASKRKENVNEEKSSEEFMCAKRKNLATNINNNKNKKEIIDLSEKMLL